MLGLTSGSRFPTVIIILLEKCNYYASYEVITKVSIQIFCDVSLCYWVVFSDVSKDRSVFIFKVQVKNPRILDFSAY